MVIDQTFNEGLPSDCSDENLNATKFAVPDNFAFFLVNEDSRREHEMI